MVYHLFHLLGLWFLPAALPQRRQRSQRSQTHTLVQGPAPLSGSQPLYIGKARLFSLPWALSSSWFVAPSCGPPSAGAALTEVPNTYLGSGTGPVVGIAAPIYRKSLSVALTPLGSFIFLVCGSFLRPSLSRGSAHRGPKHIPWFRDRPRRRDRSPYI